MGFLNLFKSNFTRIAENTTKYYLELERNYQDRFPDKASLIAAAGILDAQTYIFEEHSISLEAIIGIAQAAVSDEFTPYRRLSFLEKDERLKKSRYSKDALLDSLTSSDKSEQEPLFDFVFSLEVEIFSVDMPRFSHRDVEAACYQKADGIWNAIQKIKDKYVSEAQFASATAVFMESPQFKPFREQLGIREA